MEEKKEKTTIEKGLYKNLNVSVKVLDGVIFAGLTVLAIITVAAFLAV